MKLPTQSSSKQLSANNTSLNTAFQPPNSAPVNSYEPTSVLDLERSPSPAPPTNNRQKPPSVDLDNLEGWDSILSDLGLNDDSNNPNSKLWSQITPADSHLHQLPDFPSSQPLDQTTPPITFPNSDYSISDLSYAGHNNNFGQFDLHLHQPNVVNNNFGLDFIEDLIRAAQAFESNDSHQLHLILARLNQRLRSPAGKPLQRTAFYFKEALQHLLANGQAPPARLSSYEVVQTIRAHKAFSGISPISLFSTFAANQAILEAVDASAFIHILDFDIGFGGHWASFMRELVDKAADPGKISAIVLRITAIVPEEFGIESKLVRENLSQFARDLNINFHMEYILIQSFEIVSFKSIKFIDGEKLAVHLSPAVLHRLGGGISKFLADLRGIHPSTVVVVDREVGIDTTASSFSVNFVSGIEFYTGLLESLDVTSASGFVGGGDAVRRIETFVVKPRIVAVVEAAAEGQRRTWREEFAAARMKAVGFSQFADFQAECLLRRTQVGGFHLAKRHWEMLLCWHDRPLVSTSAWKC